MVEAARPFRVRRQSSGYASSEKFIVVMLRPGQPASRVTTWPHVTRESAQAEADRLNIGHMVKDYADDPRPYVERRAEAEAAYRAQSA